MKASQFIERRKEHRLPYQNKVIFTDGSTSTTAYASNISRGGVFVMTQEPFPIDTVVHLAFCLPLHPSSICTKAKVAHIVFDRQRCEVENGMGFQFLELTESHKSLMNVHIINEQKTYIELKKVLQAKDPEPKELTRLLKNLPWLQHYDLLHLRYRIDRICMLFETQAAFTSSEDTQKLSA